jgi:hypothetical protein
MTAAASAYALARLIERGAVVHLSTSATQVSPSGKDWNLSNGTSISADVAFQVQSSLILLLDSAHICSFQQCAKGKHYFYRQPVPKSSKPLLRSASTPQA